VAVNNSKETVYKRIETLFSCSNGEQLFLSMVSMQLELSPELNQETAESFIIYGIIKEFDDRELDRLWFHHLTRTFNQKLVIAA
jgi:hypothetical protein